MKRTCCFALLLALVCPALAADVGVRIRFGLTDTGNTDWDGSVAVAPGSVERIDGWRFEQADEVLGTTGWKASTRPLTVRRSNNAKKNAKKKGGGSGMMADNGVFLVLTGVTDASVVKIETKQGNFQFHLADIPYGKVVEELKGSVDIERVAASRPLTAKRDDDDFPVLAVAPDGSSSVAWISFTPGIDRDERARQWEKAPADFAFLAKPVGGDRLWLRTQRSGGAWSEPVAVTAGGGDLYKCAVAIDGRGRTWVFWAENTSWPAKPLANFEIFAATVADGKVSAPIKLSDAAGTDISPVATTDSSGRIWLAWQGARENAFRILERHQTADGAWSPERAVSTHAGNCWAPAIAAAADGRVAIAWDTYDKGDYDVWVREFAANGTPSVSRAVANSEDYEARASLTYDKQSRLWIAWERSGPTWGKDWGALDRAGIGLYRDRQIGMRVLAGDTWMEPAAPVASALPGARARRGPRNLPVNRPEADASTRKAGEEAEAVGANTYNNIARLACDRDGRIWLFARSREGTFHTPLGSVWVDYAASYDGDRWTGPTILPHSDNLLYNSPAVAAHPGGGFLVAHSTDHRQDRHVARGAGGINQAPAGDPFDNDIYVSRLEMATSPATLKLVAATSSPAASTTPTQATLAERAAIARARAQRITYQGKSLQLVRGEFHRHTEVSGDGGNDGPVEDMWRYAIDVAAMDWLGNGDHDNGGGREYTWWLIQKTTDAFRLPGRFDPPFTYERSVAYPEGHRNVVFAQRGVRTLPRLAKTAPEPVVHAPDTLMLFDYLRHFSGVCASHTSATDMGTDWRDNAPDVEPMVEIYQGARQNYERPGAPRSPTANDAIGGWRPLGFVNLAFKKGYVFSFESSSDHGSTHISYAMAYAEDTSREALLRAMRLRHTYASTDNIVADFRCTTGGKDYMLGDEFTTAQAPTLRLKLGGTAPFAKVTLVKDDEEIHSITPNKADVELTWTDPAPTAGKKSYYYFRGEQTDGELVWVSPMWITYAPAK